MPHLNFGDDITVKDLREALEHFDDALPVFIDTAGVWPSRPKSAHLLRMIYQDGVPEHIRVQAHYSQEPNWPAVVLTTTPSYGKTYSQEDF